jgi:uncharacterized protein YegJ (DUF2314 family)
MEFSLRPVCLVVFGASALSISSARAANVVGQELEPGSVASQFYQVPADHAAMHQAVIQARKTVRKFIVALKNPGSGQEDFEVKKPFIQAGQIEHIWLTDVQFVGNRFQGRVDNEPRKIKGLKLGQLVSVNPNEISDWLYIDNGKLVGGYTVRVRYNELTPQERQAFDRTANFKIE